jgi:penicillin-insensitive murein endopeptidase
MRLSVLVLLTLAACGSGNKASPPVVSQSAVRISTASGPKANQLFGAKALPSRQSPAPLGSYAKGCLAGAVQLPESGPTWQAMRLSRNRSYGHPVLVSYLQELSAKVAADTSWAGLYIGDMSQPRGGPMTSGHQSHQLGLDADVWLLPPRRLDLSRAEREKLSSRSVRSKDLRSVTGNWTAEHMQVLKTAASDPRVDRIFITAPAKIWMCKNARGNRDWLQKIRPYWGHHYHFHVRLKCPAGARGCVTQKPTVAQLSKGGDGCDETLNWWVTTALKPAKVDPAKKKKKRKKKRGARDYVMADLPGQCVGVLKSQ